MSRHSFRQPTPHAGVGGFQQCELRNDGSGKGRIREGTDRDTGLVYDFAREREVLTTSSLNVIAIPRGTTEGLDWRMNCSNEVRCRNKLSKCHRAPRDRGARWESLRRGRDLRGASGEFQRRRRELARPARPTSASAPGAGTTATVMLSKDGYTEFVPPGRGCAEMVTPVIAAPVE